MEDNPEKLSNFANKRFIVIIKDGFKLYIENFGYLILPFGILGIFSIFLKVVFLTEFENFVMQFGSDILNRISSNQDISTLQSEFSDIRTFFLLGVILVFLNGLISGRVSGIITVISMCLVSTFLYKKYFDGEANFFSSVKSSINKRMLTVILLIGVGISSGLFLLFIPSIIIYSFCIFLVFTYNINNIEKPISEARLIAKGAFWSLIGILIIEFLFIFFIDLIYRMIFNVALLFPYPRSYLTSFLFQILNGLFDIIFSPLILCFLTTLYTKLKAQKELNQKFAAKYYPTSEPSRETARGGISIMDTPLYCPFCGELIKTPQKFCPNCGKSLINLNL